MAKCLFDQCCGCIELRTGCLIIGYLNLIGAIIGLVFAAFIAVGTGVILSDKEVREQLNQELNAAQTAAVTTFAVVTAVILIIVLVFLFALTIVFLVGIHQNKRGHVKVFMVFMVIYLVIYSVMFFASFANTPINAGDVCTRLFSILLNVYFFLVIRSYYYKMNDASRQPAIYNTA